MKVGRRFEIAHAHVFEPFCLPGKIFSYKLLNLKYSTHFLLLHVYMCHVCHHGNYGVQCFCM